MSSTRRTTGRLVAAAVAAVALGVGGAVLPGAGLPAAPGAVASTVPPPVVEPCPATQLPLGDAALDPAAPRAPLPPPGDAVTGDELVEPGLLVPAGVPAPPPVPATSWLVADLDTGEVLAACNAHVPFAPASTIKVLTALALLPGLDPATVHTAGPASAQAVGSRVGLVEGSEYTVEDLAHGLMLSSGNDAAVALGELVGPQVALDRMTQVARAVGAWSTVPLTTNGLDADGQVSTAHDLAVLARAALAEPRVAGPASTVRYDFPASGAVGDPARGTYEIQTSSRLLRNYDGATGLKSGFTRAAGGSYVGTAERDGRRYVATVMRAQNSAWRQSATLLDWAFATGGAGGSVGTLAVPGALPEASRSREEGADGPSSAPSQVPSEVPSQVPSTSPVDPDAGGDEDGADAAPTADPLAAITGGRSAPDATPTSATGASVGPSSGLLVQLGVLAAVLALAAAAAAVTARRRRGRADQDGPPRPV